MIYDLWGEPINQELKKCIKCGEEKTLSNYTKAGGANYFRTACKSCESELSKARQKLKAKFIDSYPDENYECPICKRKEIEVRGLGGKKTSSWCCDHDHKSGKFRGWLCHDCNRALGNFKDSTDILKRASDWLEKS